MSEISELKEKITIKGLKGLALDIDETLADSNTYWYENMLKFHALEGEDVKSLIERYKFVEEVPGWNTKEAFEHMHTLMHSEEFNETVPLIEDANHVVNKIDKKIPILVYITARPATVAEATKRWLKKHNFPEGHLITRSSEVGASETDLVDRNKWKARILSDLYPNIIGIIDDNKVLAEELQKLNYQGTLYLYGQNSGDYKNYKHVISCPTWDSVLDNFK